MRLLGPGNLVRKSGLAPMIVPIFIIVIIVAALSPAPIVRAYPSNPLPAQPGFEDGKVLSGSAIWYASPTLADLDDNGQQEIIIGGVDGMLYALRANGNLLWQFDTALAINAVAPSSAPTTIGSAPAVGDLDGDGWPEVVVSMTGDPSTRNGAVIALRHDGSLMPGWPQLPVDLYGDGYVDGFWSSPALGDLDGDGDLEIVAGAWDMHIYAWHHDGSLVLGWPLFAHDTVWSSPALADLDKDGSLEVIIGTDAHDPAGGTLHVFRGDATEMPGFPKHIDQTIYSSPAVADLNNDGWLDIVVGTGNYYPGKGKKVHAWDRHGNPLPGWPVSTGDYVMSAPTVGDFDGDGQPEVAVGCNDGKLYAFNGNGSQVPGFPVTVYDNLGNNAALYYSSPVLANFDGDPEPEIWINHFCDTIVFDKDGTQLTHTEAYGPSDKPTMYMFYAWCLSSTPAIGDIDNDGKLEIVRGGGDQTSDGNALVYVWESNRGAPATAPWPVFRQDAAHHATYVPTPATVDARIVSHTLPEIMHPSDTRDVQITLQNTGTTTWTRNDLFRIGTPTNDPFAPGARVNLAQGETVAPGQQKTFSVQLQAPAAPGYYTTSWRMLHGTDIWFGLRAVTEIKVGNEPAFYVLSEETSGTGSGIFAGGLSPYLPPPDGYFSWINVKEFDFSQDGKGYLMLDTQGGVWPGGTARLLGGHGFVPQAQEILVNRNGTTYYILDAYGNLTRSYGAQPFSPAPPTFGSEVIRSGDLTPDEKGIYLLDQYGTIHTGGSALALYPTSLGFTQDIAKRIKITANGQGYYVLDAYGRVHNGGNAPAIAPNYEPRIGEIWARDLELTVDGQGYYMLDKEGYIHTGGTAVAPQNMTTTWSGQDVAVDLAVTDSRILSGPLVSSQHLILITTPNRPINTSLEVHSSTGDNILWQAQENASWLSVTPTSGTTPAQMTIQVNPSGLPLGSQETLLTITSEGASAPVTIEVRIVRELHTIHLPMIQK